MDKDLNDIAPDWTMAIKNVMEEYINIIEIIIETEKIVILKSE